MKISDISKTIELLEDKQFYWCKIKGNIWQPGMWSKTKEKILLPVGGYTDLFRIRELDLKKLSYLNKKI